MLLLVAKGWLSVKTIFSFESYVLIIPFELSVPSKLFVLMTSNL